MTDIRYSDESFDGSNLKTLLDRQERHIAATFYYQLLPKTRCFIEADQQRYAFDNVLSRRDTDSFGIYTGVEFQPGAALSGKIRLGHKTFTPDFSSSKRFAGLAGDALLSRHLSDRIVVRARYTRDTRFSIWFDNTYYVEERAGLGGNLGLLRRLHLEYDYRQGTNTYPGGAQLSSRRDNIRIHDARLVWQLDRKWDIGLSFNAWSRLSNIRAQGDDRTFWGIYVTYDDR